MDLEVLPAHRFLNVVIAAIRERAMETKEEVEVHRRLHASLLESVNRADEEAVDDPTAPYPGLRERPMV